jgi:hypothetical protein
MKVRTQAALIAMLMAMAVPVFAQQPPTPPRPPAPVRERADSLRPRMLNVEAALRFKQDLKLSDAQAAQLETLRKEIVAERQAEARDAIETQSRVAAGLISEDEVRKQFDGKRDEMRQRMEQRRERITKILTQSKVHERMRDRMHDRMGRRDGPMGRGMRFRRGPRF